MQNPVFLLMHQMLIYRQNSYVSVSVAFNIWEDHQKQVNKYSLIVYSRIREVGGLDYP